MRIFLFYISLSLISYRAAANPLECTVTTHVTSPQGQDTVESSTNTLKDDASILKITAGFRRGSGVRMIGEITRNSDDSLYVYLGDFCGEVFTNSVYPIQTSVIHNTLSYGRDKDGYWSRLDIDCRSVSSIVNSDSALEFNGDSTMLDQDNCTLRCGGDLPFSARALCMKSCRAPAPGTVKTCIANCGEIPFGSARTICINRCRR